MADSSESAPSRADEGGAAGAGEDGLLPGGFHPFRPVTHDDFTNVETNLARPLTDAVITIRVIKSFAYRTTKSLVLKNIDLTKMTVQELEERCRSDVATLPAFKAFRTYAAKLDTLKIYTRAHGAKTTNLVVNVDRPDWLLDTAEKRASTLQDLGLENEAELSLFHRADYDEFLQDPTNTKW
ncbi:unnamed protein product [Parajaminaea phylloscopi]